MLNGIIFRVTGKRLVLYSRHRQTIPVVHDEANRRKFLFLEISLLWKVIPFRSSNKMKFRIMGAMLDFIKPYIILDINWVSPYHTLYKVWTRKNSASQFVVVQHGTYIGGVVADASHRYAKCDVFLTWADRFTETFRRFNRGKKVRILTFGNPVYNQFDRDTFTYKPSKGKRVLLAPSVVIGVRLESLLSFASYLTEQGYDVYFKEHNLQVSSGTKIEGVKKEKKNIFVVLREQLYDFIITDHSTVLLDAVFFKNRVLIFSDPDGVHEYANNVFVAQLGNLYDAFRDRTFDRDLYGYFCLSKQERLLCLMAHRSTNTLPL